MSERTRNVIAVGLSVIALAVIFFGFSAEPAQPPTADDRIASLSASIRCPFCNGESLADSQAGVAADYRDLIAERVAAGATDEEILEEFAANFGDSFILDTSTSNWSLLLWAVPVLALLVGGGVVVWMKAESREQSAESTESHEKEAAVDRRTIAGVAVVGVAVIAIAVFAVNSLTGSSTSGAEGVVGDVVAGQGQVDLSEVTNEEIEAIVAANPDIVGMRLALARRYFEANEFDQALDHYMIILDKEKNPEALANVGWMTYLSGHPDIALGYVEAALQVAPDYLTATWFLGNIQFTLGNRAEATEALSTIVDSALIPDDVKEAAGSLLSQMEDG